MAINDKISAESHKPVLTTKQKISYALGDVGYNFLFDMGQLYLLKYMTDVINIPAAFAGGVFAVARIWDAFSDLAVGIWVDNRKITKRGKFHPLIEWSILPLAMILIANFSVPEMRLSYRLLWCYIAYIAFGTIYSIGNVPYGSLATAMTKNGQERNELASWRNIGSNTGLLIANTIFMPIVLMMPTKRIGYTVAVIIFAIAGSIAVMTMAKGTPENFVEKPQSKTKVKQHHNWSDIKQSFKPVLKNKALVIVCLANLFCFSAYNTELSMQFYFAEYVLHNINIVSYMSFFTIGCSILAAAVMPSISKHIGKKRTYILGCEIWIVTEICAFLITRNGWEFALFSGISYFGNGLLQALNWSLISDVVEYGEYKTHIRSEGVIYSSYTFFRKLANALAGIVPSIILSMTGYIPNQVQSSQALLGIRCAQFVYPLCCAALTAVVFHFYPITESKCKEMINSIDNYNKNK